MAQNAFNVSDIILHIGTSTNLFVSATARSFTVGELRRFGNDLRRRVREISTTYQEELKNNGLDSVNNLTSHADLCRTTLRKIDEIETAINVCSHSDESSLASSFALQNVAWIRAHMEAMEYLFGFPANSTQ